MERAKSGATKVFGVIIRKPIILVNRNNFSIIYKYM
jgi:hypothetical protein